MDVRDGFSAMEPGQRAYAIKVEVVVSDPASGQLLFTDTRAKVICTPIIGAGSLRSKITCDDDARFPK